MHTSNPTPDSGRLVRAAAEAAGMTLEDLAVSAEVPTLAFKVRGIFGEELTGGDVLRIARALRVPARSLIDESAPR